jgi:hypothetical protein
MAARLPWLIQAVVSAAMTPRYRLAGRSRRSPWRRPPDRYTYPHPDFLQVVLGGRARELPRTRPSPFSYDQATPTARRPPRRAPAPAIGECVRVQRRRERTESVFGTACEA